MAFEQEIKVYRFQQGYAEGLLAGLDADRAFSLICDSGVNPAWIIGHLATAANNVIALLGGEPQVDSEVWQAKFSGGTQAGTDPADYPAWEEILDVYRQSHDALIAAVQSATAEQLASPNPLEALREPMPTVHDFLSFVLTGHVAMHLGQLSTWRRIQGQPPLF